MYRECVHDDTFDWHSHLYLEPGFFDVAHIDRACLRTRWPTFYPVIPRGLRTYWDLPESITAEGITRNFQLSPAYNAYLCLLMPTDAYTNPSEDVIDGCYLGCNYVST